MGAASDHTRGLAELAVRLGANVQPGQIVVVVAEPGMEPLTRAVAEVAYEQGAKFARRMNSSGIHIDFMIGGDDVAVSGLTRGGDHVPLLRGDVWQV